MRTVEDIKARITTMENSDFFGTQRGDLISFLPFDHAMEYFKDLVDTSERRTEWDAQESLPEPEYLIEQMREYFSFALGKAEDHRGLSAGRSIDHYRVWLWLLEDEALLALANSENQYPQYGVPILRAIGEKYGFEIPMKESWFRNMAAGEPCTPDCNEGCENA